MSNGNIPDDIIDAVLKSHDIVEVVSKYVHLTKQGKNHKGLCPFHSEKSPSFTVSADKQIFNCFGCGTGGNAIKFMMEIEGLSFPETVTHLAEEANIPVTWKSIDNAPKSALQLEKETLIQAHELSAKWFHYVLKNSEHGKPAMNYLRSRGFSDKLIDTFQIGYAPPMWDTLTQFLTKKEFDPSFLEKGGLISSRSSGSGHVDRFRDRIMFPIFDFKGQVIAFAGRVLQEDVQPKYLNTPETIIFNKSKNLYNLHQAKATIRKTQTIVLFEGYADVIKAWDAGLTNGVAAMGTALSAEHATVMKRYANNVVLCYDGDGAGRTAAYKNIPILEQARMDIEVAMLPDGSDPDDFIAQQGADVFQREIVETSVPAVKYKLIYMKKEHSLQTDQGLLNYIRSALTIIAELQTPTEREHYLKELSSEFDYSFDSLRQEMNEIRQKMQKNNRYGDNNINSWNNVMNETREVQSSPALLPAYHNAEKYLLAIMMNSQEITKFVEQEIGDQFNVEIHAALAAYLYAFFAQNDEPNVSRFLSTLNNDQLERSGAAISMMDIRSAGTPEVVDDYIQTILSFPQQQLIDHKKKEMQRAEKIGDVMEAAHIAKEIITLERQLK